MNHKIINLGILAHVDAGKTTLTESILYHSHITKDRGAVDKGTTITDSMDLEKARGITIRSSTVSFFWKDIKINLIDTPGHADFIGEVERSLCALDGVVLVVSAVEGVQPQTRILFRHLQRMGMPVIIFVNKIDRMGSSYQRTLSQIQKQLSSQIISMQEVMEEENIIKNYPLSYAPLKQEIISFSDHLMEAFLEGKKITNRQCFYALKNGVKKGEIYPIYAGAALKDIGICDLMDAIVTWLPSKISNEDTKRRLSAYVYKVEYDEKGKKSAFFRIFSGKIQTKDKVNLTESKEEIVINNLYTIVNGKQEKVFELNENDIGILKDVAEIRCGDYLGRKWKHKGLIKWGEPMLMVDVALIDETQRFQLLKALKILENEDPLLQVQIDKETQDIQMNLFGKLQIEIIEKVIKDRFDISVSLRSTKTICKAKPKKEASAVIHITDKDNFHHAGIEFKIEPLPSGVGNQYETQVSFGYLKKPFQNAVEEGVKKALAKRSIVDTKITFVDAQFYSVSSAPADFRRLAPVVIDKALEISGVKKVEPVMTYQLLAPMAYEKEVISALKRIDAYIENIDFSETEIVLSGIVSYDKAKDFKVDISTITKGQGIFEMEFLEYRQVNS